MSSIEKALSTTTGQGGDAIVPQLSDQVIPIIRQKSYLRQFLHSFRMPTNTFRFPKLQTGSKAYFVGENGVAPEAPLGTGTVEINAKKIMSALEISAELEEDAVMPIVPIVREDMAKEFALAEEKIFINGNTTHLATAPTLAAATETNWYVNDVRLAFNGLLNIATAPAVDAGNLPFELEHITQAIENLDVYGRDVSELLLIVSLKEQNRLRKLLGVNLTTNQLGLTGTALPGEIGKVYGIPVVCTNVLVKDTSNYASGLTQALLVYRNAAVIGDRRQFVIKTSDELLLRSDGLLTVSSERIGFAGSYPDAITTINNIVGV